MCIQSWVQRACNIRLKLSNPCLLTRVLAMLQVTALQNGNSFNTMLRQNNQVQTISINRTMNHLSVQGAFSNANITNTGTQACGVSHPAKRFITCFCADLSLDIGVLKVWQTRNNQLMHALSLQDFSSIVCFCNASRLYMCTPKMSHCSHSALNWNHSFSIPFMQLPVLLCCKAVSRQSVQRPSRTYKRMTHNFFWQCNLVPLLTFTAIQCCILTVSVQTFSCNSTMSQVLFCSVFLCNHWRSLRDGAEYESNLVLQCTLV